jgi:hypothetical protein
MLRKKMRMRQHVQYADMPPRPTTVNKRVFRDHQPHLFFHTNNGIAGMQPEAIVDVTYLNHSLENGDDHGQGALSSLPNKTCDTHDADSRSAPESALYMYKIVEMKRNNPIRRYILVTKKVRIRLVLVRGC